MKTTGLEIRKRIATLFFIFVVVICLLAGRFFWLQVVRGDELAERAWTMDARYYPQSQTRDDI